MEKLSLQWLCLMVGSILQYIFSSDSVSLLSCTGGIALDPTHFKSNDSSAISEAWALHNASVEVGKFVGSLQPDILLLSTPHGIADLTDFSFYLNSKVTYRAHSNTIIVRT